MRYAKVFDDIWIDKKFRDELNEKNKLMFLYLLTCKHCNLIGFFRLPMGYLLSDMRISEKDALQRLSDITSTKMAIFNSENEMVLIPKYLKWNPLGSTQQIIGGAKIFNQMLKNPLDTLFYSFAIEFCPPIKAYISKGIDTLSIPYTYPIDTLKNNEIYPIDRVSISEAVTVTETVAETETVIQRRAVETDFSAEVVSTLTLVSGDKHPITAEQVQQFSKSYPAADVMLELSKMESWLMTNPKKRKTASGIMRFVNSWLTRVQDQGGSRRTPSAKPRYKSESQTLNANDYAELEVDNGF